MGCIVLELRVREADISRGLAVFRVCVWGGGVDTGVSVRKKAEGAKLCLPYCQGGWPAGEGAILTAWEVFKEGACDSGTPSCWILQEAVAVAESPGAVTEPHGPQEKVSARRGRKVGALGSGP